MRSERIRIGDEYYLLASALAPRRPKILLSHEESFGIFDLAGDVPLAGLEPYGLFHRGTRFLDRFELRVNGEFPVLLASTPSDDACEIVSHLSNADERAGGEVVLVRDTVSIERSKTLRSGVLVERLRLRNYGLRRVELGLELLYGADFADEFEIRGVERPRRGERREPQTAPGRVCLPYVGLDGVARTTEIVFRGAPWEIRDGSARLELLLDPGAEAATEVEVRCHVGDVRVSGVESYAAALQGVRAERQGWIEGFPRLFSSNEGFNDWMNRALVDLAMLRSTAPPGECVHAGIPWFATVFGRDSIFTALELLAFAPGLAAGTLRRLASLQGRKTDPERDEEPGKILHELRHGEMAGTGEIPFGRYYGSVDATPLFLVLFAETVERTADLALARELWPAARAAMEWVERIGDRDGDGYVEYARMSPKGLVHQGWKDSRDAVVHADGRIAEPPIALAEVQGYVYAALRGMARVARRLDFYLDASTWEAKAARLQEQFERDFWLDDEGIYALALDGQKRPCRVVASNAGHCLFAGIAAPERAARVIERLLREDMFSGFGVRTLSERERRYNPMSYHDGSVWPHDNAVIAAGFSRYGAPERAAEILTGLFDAILGIEDRRLPELFCGFRREGRHGPVPYPVACKPQAWAAGAVFLLLQAVLGLRIEGFERRVTFERSTMPSWLERLEIRGLALGEARVDLAVERGRYGVAVEVIDKRGDLEVVVRK